VYDLPGYRAASRHKPARCGPGGDAEMGRLESSHAMQMSRSHAGPGSWSSYPICAQARRCVAFLHAGSLVVPAQDKDREALSSRRISDGLSYHEDGDEFLLSRITPSVVAPTGQALEGANVRRVRAFVVETGHLEHPGQVHQRRVSQHALEGPVAEQSPSDILVAIDRAA
jgi:hypothetical protein